MTPELKLKAYLLTDEQIVKLLPLLEEQDDTVLAELAKAIESQQTSVISKPRVLYVSSYKRSTHYGGPEEGGWTYENMRLISTQCFVVDGYQSDMQDVYDALISLIDDSPHDFVTRQAVNENLEEHGSFTYDDPQYEGLMYAVETLPGTYCDTQKRYFE